MRVVSVAGLALLVGAVACQQDVATAPRSTGDLRYGFTGDNPPPPPIDTGAVGTARSSSTPTMTFSLSVRYFFNKPGASGWLKFNKKIQDDGVSVDNSANIKFSGGVFTGKGVLQIVQSIGTLTIDLGRVTFTGSQFAGCETTPGTTGSPDLPPGPCFSIKIQGASFSGPGTSSNNVDVTLDPFTPSECGSDCTIVPTESGG